MDGMGERKEGILPNFHSCFVLVVQDVDSEGFDVEQFQPLVSKQCRGMEAVRCFCFVKQLASYKKGRFMLQ